MDASSSPAAALQPTNYQQAIVIRTWLSGISHGQGSCRITNLLRAFIRNTSVGIALVGLAVAALEFGTTFRSSGPGLVTVGVLGMRASKLIHKIRNDAMKMNTIVKSTVLMGGRNENDNLFVIM